MLPARSCSHIVCHSSFSLPRAVLLHRYWRPGHGGQRPRRGLTTGGFRERSPMRRQVRGLAGAARQAVFSALRHMSATQARPSPGCAHLIRVRAWLQRRRPAPPRPSRQPKPDRRHVWRRSLFRERQRRRSWLPRVRLAQDARRRARRCRRACRSAGRRTLRGAQRGCLQPSARRRSSCWWRMRGSALASRARGRGLPGEA